MSRTKSASLIAIVASCLLGIPVAHDAATSAAEPRAGGADANASTVWTTGAALMPAWGFYPLGQDYDGTKPLREVAAWNRSGKRASLTWVHTFASSGTYHVWARQYGGFAQVEVSVDEKPLVAGKGGPGGARYVWVHLGTCQVTDGQHHIDVAVPNGMFDAILEADG